MNIFYLNHNPEICAQQHCDKHVVKMILEYAQLLSTAHHVLDEYVIYYDIYKPTHINHPSSKWVRASSENYKWLLELWKNLMLEYTHRYGRVHASSRLLPYLEHLPIHIQEGEFFQPPPAMPDEYITTNNSIVNYQNYYKYGKTKLLKYTKREKPTWLGDEEDED